MQVILNADSGRNGRIHSLEHEIRRQLTPSDSVARVDHATPIEAIAARAVATGERLVVACGGDGTVNAIAATLVNTKAALGIIPAGTFNHFARDLGIPLDLDEAIRTLREGHIRSVDVGEVNGRVFLNNSSLGLYPSLVRYREHQEKRYKQGRPLATATALWRALRFHRPIPVDIEINGKRIHDRTSFLFVGNNVYDKSWLRARRRLDEGVLTLITTHEPGRARLLWLALRAFWSRKQAADEIELETSQQITLHSRRAQLPVSFDGEVSTMKTPLRYRILPKALRVVVASD